MHRALILAVLGSAPITGRVPAGTSPEPARPVPDVVEIETDDSLILKGSYYKPRKRSPAVVLVHDAGADRSQMTAIAERIHKQGFGVLTLDLRGHGESKTTRFDWSKLDESKQASLWQLAPRDVDAAARWVLGQDNIHSTNLSLVGYRAGCALVARHAEKDENVMCMTLLSPKKNDFGFDVAGAIQNLVGLPTYVIDQRNDEVERLVSEANALMPHPYVEFVMISDKKPSVIEDKSTPSKVAKWIGEVAQPKRGR